MRIREAAVQSGCPRSARDGEPLSSLPPPPPPPSSPPSPPSPSVARDLHAATRSSGPPRAPARIRRLYTASPRLFCLGSCRRRAVFAFIIPSRVLDTCCPDCRRDGRSTSPHTRLTGQILCTLSTGIPPSSCTPRTLTAAIRVPMILRASISSACEALHLPVALHAAIAFSASSSPYADATRTAFRRLQRNLKQ
ncbi:hypothetical protein PUN28_006467 [Cardiocondyla obscurior]|uniref:Uncharacterized protein n=1 Tax=Cardiocondyla obscurior TaxID=286306 RepID=A0AAW2GAF7_9HYME